MASFLDKSIEKIVVKTAYGPDIVLNRPFEPSPAPSPFLTALKPQILLYTAYDSEPISLSPYGKPPPTKWPIIATGATFLAAVGAAAIIGRILVKRKSKTLSGLPTRRRLPAARRRSSSRRRKAA